MDGEELRVVEEIRDDLKTLRSRVYGNGGGRPGIVEQLVALDLRVEGVDRVVATNGERITDLTDAVRKGVMVKGLPVYWWLIAALLALNVLLVILFAASVGVVDADVLVERGTAIVLDQDPGHE